MASAYPKAGADYKYRRRGLGVRPAFVVGWVMIAGDLIAAAAVALGFGGYFNRFLDVGVVLPAIGVLALAGLILGGRHPPRPLDLNGALYGGIGRARLRHCYRTA